MLHLVKAAANPSGSPAEDLIGEDSMRGGVRLVDWFGHEARRIYAMLSEDGQQAEDRKLLELIQQQDGRVTVRDLMRGPRSFRKSSEKAEAALQKLVDAGYGYWEHGPQSSKGGAPTKVFVLKPSGDGDRTNL